MNRISRYFKKKVYETCMSTKQCNNESSVSAPQKLA